MIQGSGKFSEYIERLPLPDVLKLRRYAEKEFEEEEVKDHVIVVGNCEARKETWCSYNLR